MEIVCKECKAKLNIPDEKNPSGPEGERPVPPGAKTS